MCLFPMRAEIGELGKIVFNTEGDLKVPCGRCNECISKRAVEWATRARHEISLHRENSFITLTYDDANLPSIYIVKIEFQKFMKRLRKLVKRNLRYMVSHEYGTNTFRPHHHAIIFGYNPQNQKYLKTTAKGEKLFTSDELTKLWRHGFHSIGTANEKTAYYIASYSLKGKKHSLLDKQSGEYVDVSDCMDSSKRPAIGYNFFKENYTQMIDSDSIIPRYYLKKLKEENPLLHERYENERMFKFKNRSAHETYAKYVIDEQKLSLKSEFRDVEPNLQNTSEHLKTILLTERDRYHEKTKDKK